MAQEYPKDAPLTVMVEGARVADDSLHELQGVLNRNRGPCHLPIGDLTGQVLRLAEKNLRLSNVWDTDWPNGERVLFIGKLPRFVGVDAVLRAAVKHEHNHA